MESINKAKLAVLAAEEKKAQGIKLLDLKGLTMITDYFLIVTGGSKPQTQAIANAIEEKLGEEKISILRREGYQEGRWILLDFGDLVVHIFLPEERDFYGIERLWGDAKDLTIDALE